MSLVKKSFRTLREFSAFLLIGTVIALLWANADHHSYHHFIEEVTLFTIPFLEEHGGHHGPLGVNFHFFVNDFFMVLFFGIAAKEVSESFLPGGALSSLQKASMPIIGTMGGVFGPIGLFFALAAIMGLDSSVIQGAWAVPAATDIAYAWLFAGLIFGRGHPAVTFLLVLAVVDDLIGMSIIAVYYTSGANPMWLLLVAAGMLACEILRRMGVKNFWPYVLIGGPLAWIGLYNTGVHASLALVPIVPFMPHAERDAGLFAEDIDAHDTMHEFEEFLGPIVDVGLFTFGLANAGVVLSTASFQGSATWVILLSLLVGKTVGIAAFVWVGERFGLSLPEKMEMRTLPIVGMIAGIGFTVALFVVTVASGSFQLGKETVDMLKLGALLSFVAGPLAYLGAQLLGVEKIHADEAAGSHGGH